MPAKRTLPLSGILLALIAGAGMLLAGASLWLSAAVVVLWLGSLWLVTPEPEIQPEKVDVAAARSDAIHDAIEPIGQPLLLLDGNRIVEANQAARAALGEHVLGQDARIALRHPDAMKLLDLGDGDSVSIPGFTGGRSLWQLTRRNVADGRWMIELVDRTAEADMSKAHTDFVANASHELRTPLAAIIGYAETLGDPDAPTDAETTQRFNGIIQREAARMLSLVEDLMTLSHVEAEKHDRPSEPLDLGQLAARVVGEVSSLKGKERVELAVAEPGLIVLGDAGQLEQLLRNLIDNALKYGGADTPVSVAVSHQGDASARLAVADQGPGIAPEHLPHLTRRFYRTDPGRSRASGGTGLGLAIVKHIVERHQGEIEFASTLGEGTTVTVTLPLPKS
ncbi:ATP-binding protein [Novosphingobium sp.]|uniref:sensor histidine kinase n=1 Tax=Novosphingobium sp. TaxID=1874826 RepID=UPI0025DA605A|nr:ATP-binding protein [Novosphingobium sp.]MCC6925814.1 two-component sensor histidine kinase [Novosphingobium sp.]